MFPIAQNEPTCGVQFGAGVCIACDVGSDLHRPILYVVIELSPPVRRAPMPEASVYKYGNPSPSEHDVRPSPQSWFWRNRNPIAKAPGMEGAPK